MEGARFSRGGPRLEQHDHARPALRPLEGTGLDNAAKTDGLADEELQRYGTVLTANLGPKRWNYDGEL